MNLIFSVFIENDECVDTGTKEYQYTDENKISKFGKYRKFLEEKQQEYANKIGVDYKLYTSIGNFTEAYNLGFLSKYDIINFYKIYLFYQNPEYENILYIDFDVIPNTTDNFFDHHELHRGIHVKTSNHLVTENMWDTELKKSIRSPFAKYYNSHAMLISEFGNGDNNVFNTGILGMNQDHIHKLGYFKDFQTKIEYMTEIKNDSGMYPESVSNLFNYDNETLFSYLIEKTETPWVELDDFWHYVYDKQDSIDPQAKLIHFINKRFEDY